MSRRAVRVGDPTTTGGIVISGSSDMYSNNKTIAVDGDKATCGNCEGAFPIVGSAVYVISHGRCMAIEGDLVLCPCGQNLLIAGSDCTFFYEDDGNHTAANPFTVSSAFAHARQASALGIYDEQFVLVDAFGRPLANARYRVVTDSGQILTGTTDSAGQTRRFATDAATSLKIYAMGF
ncbi:PAAR domain-containing protein [Burkholderia sp. Ac-20384]|uniref:PAAR domain-containing protein n=1 Tax=Burkholderia sp. Ac-20384 TaxID=2703902 RepID=UPI00197CD942|nr:PAAR domain-containing protein [Burkholderia sp. Ac-20384]MBN3826471.1 PAAR domain-containing protein [Burkholderia sp. Ac-20384]